MHAAQADLPPRRLSAFHVALDGRAPLPAGLARVAVGTARQRGADLIALDAGGAVPEDLAGWIRLGARFGLGVGVRVGSAPASLTTGAAPWLALIDDSLGPADDRSGPGARRDAAVASWADRRLARVGLAFWPDDAGSPRASQPFAWPGDAIVAWHPTSPRPAATARQDAATPLDAPPPPRPEPVSNQFDLQLQQGRDPHEALTAAEAARTVVVATPAGDEVYKIVGDALSAGEVALTVETLQQLYLDVSDKARLDDFEADLRALVRIDGPAVRGGGVVPSRWAVRDEPPFAAAERALRGILAGLRGLVVDIGAGPVRYLRVLDAAARAGRLQYVAVEPDAGHLEALVDAVTGGVLVRGVGEALPLADATADAAMFLRSWNHLVDVDAAVAEVARVLRPGGQLVAVDNVAFGLLRTPDQLARAHAVSVRETPFEHFRNANADHCVEALRRHGGFDVERVDAVGPGRANQWLVLARRSVAAPGWRG